MFLLRVNNCDLLLEIFFYDLLSISFIQDEEEEIKLEINVLKKVIEDFVYTDTD